MRRTAAKPSKAKPSRETVEPPSGTVVGATIWSVKFWFGNPAPHVHTYVPGVRPRLWIVLLLKVMLSDRAVLET